MPDLPSTGEFATAPGDLVNWDLRRAGGHRMDIMFAVLFGQTRCSNCACSGTSSSLTTACCSCPQSWSGVVVTVCHYYFVPWAVSVIAVRLSHPGHICL